MKKKKKKKQRRQKHVSVERNRAEFENFLSEMMQWFSDHQHQIDQLFSRRGSMQLNDFELGLVDLDVPRPQPQLHVVTQQLKTSSSSIRNQDFSRQLHRLSDITERRRHMFEDFTQTRDEAGAGKTLCLEPKPENHSSSSFVRLSLRMIHLDWSEHHPGNFQVVLWSGCRVFSLIRMIQDRVGIQTSRLEVFRSRVPTEEARLPPESSLKECGLGGGPEESPAESTVFYDYRLMLTDCPVLNCDHYLRSRPDHHSLLLV